ncbi:MAG: menaquinone biosynthetic enzyme MqnA/MqnD family protein [Planctomycetota bacterium]|jgi:chorismate dehydratase
MSTTVSPAPAQSEHESVPIRIGCVSYFNTLPMIEGLEKLGGVTLERAAPSNLEAMLESGDVDVALAPVIDSQRASCEITLLPCGMIGSDGATMTVRLFSTIPLEQVSTIHCDTDSHTSIALARLVMHHTLGVEPTIVAFNARERMSHDEGGAQETSFPETMLLIGDKVVTDSPPAVRYSHQLDLGEAWKSWTGLPFVYAAWMCRSEDADTAPVRGAMALLDRQRRLNATRLGWLVARRACERRWPIDLGHEYLRKTMRYEVDDEARLAVERFFDESERLGILGTRGATRWLDEA